VLGMTGLMERSVYHASIMYVMHAESYKTASGASPKKKKNKVSKSNLSVFERS